MLRAELDLAQIATTTSLQPQIEIEPLIDFERKLTDEYANLIYANSYTSWDKLCDRSKPGGIHASLGRWLAFNYATARNYVFELQTPALFQTWRDGKQNKLTQYLEQDLDEATKLAADLAAGCFTGVSYFDDHRRQWMGQFQLNVAQLRLDRLPALPVSDQEAERTNIGRLLDGARDLLGPTPPDDRTPVERLLSRPLFENQRLRVTVLQSLLKNPRE